MASRYSGRMGEFSSYIASFAWAFARQWAKLMTGGVIIGALRLWEHIQGQFVPISMYVGLAVVFGMVALFFMWLEQAKEIAALKIQSVPVSFEYENKRPYFERDAVGQLWIRVKAINATEREVVCRVDLNGLEKIGEEEPFWAHRPLQLQWEGTEFGSPDNRDRLIPAGQSRYFNLALIGKDANELSLQNGAYAVEGQAKLYPGTYRFTVQAVLSSRSEPTEIQVKYDGNQDVSFVKS